MSEYKVSMVPVEHIDFVWPSVRSYMKRAARYTHGRYQCDDILTAITDYDHQLWVAFKGDNIKGAVVTSLKQYPRKRYLDLVFIGGEDAINWKAPMLKILQHWAFDNSCDGIESSGRAGWARALEEDGYKFLWQTYELPIADCGIGA